MTQFECFIPRISFYVKKKHRNTICHLIFFSEVSYAYKHVKNNNNVYKQNNT